MVSEKTGILPYNPNVFSDVDFVVHDTRQQELEEMTEADEANTTTPRDIREVPVIEASTSTRRGSALLVTGLAHRKNLENCSTKKNTPVAKRKRNASMPSSSKKTRQKRAPTPSDSESYVDIEYDSTDDDNEDDTTCPVYDKMFSQDKRGEKWIRCTKCFTWFHEICCRSSTSKTYICRDCLYT
ncbi:uncharacterized protein LOC143366665 [Andrena cerasifolii]|uniref:uncharacterized protein LOC143366665 n=1 Tax=Andrena cerasifolii TaxID=2819439 RepID=UPI004037F9CC